MDLSADRSRSFAETLVDLSEQGASGVLEVKAGEITTRIFVSRGLPVFADGGALGETLGRLLLKQGRITAEQHNDALVLMRAGLATNPQVRIGEVLVQMGLLRPDEVFEALRLQMREKLLACFQWDELAIAFQGGEAQLDKLMITERLALEPLLLEGIKRHYDPPRLDAVLGSFYGRALALRGDAGALAQRFGMNGREQRFMLDLAGKQTVALRTLVDNSPLDGIHARQIVTALVFAGLATRAAVAAQPTPARGVPVPPSTPARGAAASPTPARGVPVAKPPAPKPAPKAVVPPPAKDDRAAKLQADEAFQLGKRMLRENHLAAALRGFKKAQSLQPDEAEYQLFVAWGECLSARDPSQQPPLRAKAREAAQRMLKQDRLHQMSHHVLGQVHKLEGEPDKAIHYFQRAVELNDRDFDSERELRLLRMRESKTKKKDKPKTGDEES